MADFAPNTLYYGDNLHVLRDFPDRCVDLVYLDPPFNSNRSYNVLFKEAKGTESEAQIEAFGHTWEWGPHASETYDEVVSKGDDVGRLLQAFVQALGPNDVTVYLTMMAPRLVELRRVMKPTASLGSVRTQGSTPISATARTRNCSLSNLGAGAAKAG